MPKPLPASDGPLADQWGQSGVNWPNAGLAQLVEQLPCKHQVEGSNPSAGTIPAPPPVTPKRHRPEQNLTTSPKATSLSTPFQVICPTRPARPVLAHDAHYAGFGTAFGPKAADCLFLPCNRRGAGERHIVVFGRAAATSANGADHAATHFQRHAAW